MPYICAKHKTESTVEKIPGGVKVTCQQCLDELYQQPSLYIPKSQLIHKGAYRGESLYAACATWDAHDEKFHFIFGKNGAIHEGAIPYVDDAKVLEDAFMPTEYLPEVR